MYVYSLRIRERFKGLATDSTCVDADVTISQAIPHTDTL
jgi:hypothetical protein